MLWDRMDLESLYVYVGSENKNPKIRQKSIAYINAYQNHFHRFRNARPVVLEIGCGYPPDPANGKHLGMGGSLDLWKAYFGETSTIIGCDIIEGCRLYEQAKRNIYVEIGDQSDKVFLCALIDKYGPFDIIIDDGSHLDHHIKASFDVLFPYLKSGGIYAVEDLDGFVESGNSFMSDKRFIYDATRMALNLQKYSERTREQHAAGLLDYEIEHLCCRDVLISSVHFYRNLAIIEKSFEPQSTQMPMPPHFNY